MVEFLFLVLGIAVGYNIRHERQIRRENLVFEKVDARVRKELEIAKNLNQSLQADVAELKRVLGQCPAPSRAAALAQPLPVRHSRMHPESASA